MTSDPHAARPLTPYEIIVHLAQTSRDARTQLAAAKTAQEISERGSQEIGFREQEVIFVRTDEYGNTLDEDIPGELPGVRLVRPRPRAKEINIRTLTESELRGLATLYSDLADLLAASEAETFEDLFREPAKLERSATWTAPPDHEEPT